jgi:triacylglycerol lipase
MSEETTSISPEMLLMFAKIASTTYENPPASKPLFKELGFKIIKFFDISGAQAYFLSNGTFNVLSFRGTEVKEKSDVLADLKAGKNLEQCGGKVHHGFKYELDKLWSTIQETCNNNPGNLYVTGHSLGAAMATIAASRLQPNVISLVTFGSPRVGTKEFVSNLNIKHFRVQNNNDAVTKVPFYIMGFRHHGECVYLNFYGELRKLSSWQRFKDMVRSRRRAYLKFELFKAVYDHLMANYIGKLEKLNKGN